MKENPLVSICTPCYNHQKYLQDFFDSIMVQIYDNIELIIIDDLSNDESVKVIENNIPKLLKKCKNVVFEKNYINLGIVKNANKALKYAKGKYIKEFASDDIMLPGCLKYQIEFMEENPQYIMSCSNGFVVSDDYHYGDSVVGMGKGIYTNEIGKGLLFEKLMYGNIIFAPGVMYRKEIFEKYGYYDSNLKYEDYDYWCRISRKEEIAIIDKMLVCYRRSETSISNYNTKDGLKKFKYIFDGGKEVIRKHIKYMPHFQRRDIWEKYYLSFFEKAIDNNFKIFSRKIYKTLKKNGVSMSKELKRRYLLSLFK